VVDPFSIEGERTLKCIIIPRDRTQQVWIFRKNGQYRMYNLDFKLDARRRVPAKVKADANSRDIRNHPPIFKSRTNIDLKE